MIKTYGDKRGKICGNLFNLCHLRAKLVALLLCLGLVACKNRNPFPLEPHLEFVSFEKIDNGQPVDSIALLVLHFTDGDGNIGLDDKIDNYPPFNDPDYCNFFVLYYVKRNSL
jgi:hypothetical protein